MGFEPSELLVFLQTASSGCPCRVLLCIQLENFHGPWGGFLLKARLVAFVSGHLTSWKLVFSPSMLQSPNAPRL